MNEQFSFNEYKTRLFELDLVYGLLHLNYGHSVVIGVDDDDAGVSIERALQVAYEDAEKRYYFAIGHALRSAQRPFVLATCLTRKKSTGQKIQLRQLLFLRNRQPKRLQLLRPGTSAIDWFNPTSPLDLVGLYCHSTHHET